MLARTPYTERLMKRQLNGQPSRDGATPTAHPPTPLTSVPPTPLTAKGSSKHPQMILTEANVHEWEAEVINRTAPPLYLQPAKDFAESQGLIEAMAHPLHSAAPPAPKARKRTTAELAADEAQAASEERFMLIYDERHTNLLAGGAAGGNAEVGGSGGTGSFEPSFKRFKMLENVRMQHAEKERTKKEQEAEQAHLKRQRGEAEAAKKRERSEQDRQFSHQQAQRHAQQQENVQRQQQIQQSQRAAAEHAQSQQQPTMSIPATTIPQQIPMSMPQASHLQASQPSQLSPIIRQQTPMSASPTINGTPINMVAMTSVPMATSMSNQGAGSPARPLSAMQQNHQGLSMARQASQQHGGSSHGTPQVQNTPSTQSAVPVTRHMTPTPRVNQGSPISGQMQLSTPSMMPSQLATPTPGQQYTPEQRQHLMRQQQIMQQARHAQQLQSMGNPITQQQQAIIIQYQQQQRQAQHAQQMQQMNTPTPQNGMGHNMSQSMQMQHSQMMNGQMQQQMSGQQQQQQATMANIQARMHAAKQQMTAQYQHEQKQRHQAFMARFQGMPPPPDQVQAYQQSVQQQKIRANQIIETRVNHMGKGLMQQAQQAQQGQQMANGGQHGMMGQQMANGGQNQQQMMANGGQMGANGNMVGQQGNPASQQYMVQLQQQRAQMVARQRVINMQQMGAQQGGQPGMNHGMMNGMPNGLPNATNGGMGGGMGGMGGQMNGGMGGGGQMPQGMNSLPNTANMNQQQMMALQQQMMAQRQQHQMGMGQNGMNGMGGMM